MSCRENWETKPLPSAETANIANLSAEEFSEYSACSNVKLGRKTDAGYSGSDGTCCIQEVCGWLLFRAGLAR
jgi:hypothetical protein